MGFIGLDLRDSFARILLGIFYYSYSTSVCGKLGLGLTLGHAVGTWRQVSLGEPWSMA